MDPRLREVLEALDDEAYMDNDEDLFGELAKDGEEVDEAQFDMGSWDEEDDGGWQSDGTARPAKEYKDDASHGIAIEQHSAPADGCADAEEDDRVDEDWMAKFTKFKESQNSRPRSAARPADDLQSSIVSSNITGGRRKKRKGALTSQSGYSMTSSSLFRTEGLTTLDARFEKMEQQYMNDDDIYDEGDMASVSAASSTMSTVQGPNRSDFDSIMDDFLGNYSMSGKKHVKKGRYQSGLEQLDEVRKGLGPARISRPQKV
jgi:protein LTV1